MEKRIMEERKPQWDRMLLAALIAALLFTLGLLLGHLMSLYTKSNTEILTQSVYNDLMETQIQKDLLNEYPCSDQGLTLLSGRLDNIGSTLDLLEKRLGIENEEVLNIKRMYILLQLNHYLLEEKRNKECFSNDTLIFFFYSNVDSSQKGTDIANILQYARTNYRNIKVYSFDNQIKLDAIEVMKTEYNITALPVVVINSKKIDRLNSINDLLSYI